MPQPPQPGPAHPPATLQFDRGTLLLEGWPAGRPPGPEAAEWAWDERIGAWRCEAMHHAAVRASLATELGARFRDELPRPARVFWPQVALPTLRTEQEQAVQAWLAAGGRGQVVMPTGTGKTEVALAAMARTRTATLVVAPVRELMYQWHRRILKGLGFDAGIVGDNLFNLKPVTVTTYDSAAIHMPEIGQLFGLLVFDEEHHLPGPTYRQAAIMSAAPMRLGLTATPERYDGRHADLDWLIGPVAFRLAFDDARGRLADFEVVRIPVALSTAEQAEYDRCGAVVRRYIADRRRQQPGYTWEELCAESGRDPRARLAMKAYRIKQSIEDRAQEKLRALEDIFRLHAGQNTIVFAGSTAMALEVSRRFWVPTILAHTRKRERQALLEGFAAGRLPVLVANQVLDEGVDVPEAKVAVVIGGLASTRQARQRLGRILRPHGGALATLYEIVSQDTAEVRRSRARRRNEAFDAVPQRRRL